VTISAASLTEITQTLADMQNAPASTTTSPMTTQQSQAFALTLSQAASALSSSDATSSLISTTPGTSLPALPGASAAAPTATGVSTDTATAISTATGTTSEWNLLMLLLAGQQNASSSATSLAATMASSPGAAGVPVTGTPSSASPDASHVISLAASLEGTPYVWGGSSTSGFDCSGLVQYVYGQSGVTLPRTSQEQATVGSPVASLSQAQPGDLLFFAGSDGTSNSPGHVGIYIGNGQMIDAPYTGTVVQQQPVDAAAVVGIRRVLPDVATNSVVMGQVTVPAQYVTPIETAAAANGIPSSLLAALVAQESGFNPSAVSSAGAQGIAQIMPSTAAGMGVNPLDANQSINAAAQLLSSYSARFGSYANALAAYNAGPNAVQRYGGVPPYPETQAYVPAVLSLAGLSPSTSGSVA
jgi:peptidoglycan DL-endopeptidase CwlO